MDKLIDYSGLETFRGNVINDNNISYLSSWSSGKLSYLIAALDARITALEPQPNPQQGE